MSQSECVLDFIVAHEKCSAKEIGSGCDLNAGAVQAALRSLKRGGHIVAHPRPGAFLLFSPSSDRQSPAEIKLGVLRVLQEAGREVRASEVANALSTTPARMRRSVGKLAAMRLVIKRVESNRNTWLRLPSMAERVPIPEAQPRRLAPAWIPRLDLIRFFETMGGSENGCCQPSHTNAALHTEQ